MDPTSPPNPGSPGPRCPACGAPRIMSAAGPCYQCEVMMAPYQGTMPGKLGNAVLSQGLRTFRIIMGSMYLLCFGIAVMLVANFGWVALLLTAFGFPCFAVTLDHSQRRTRLGNPLSWQEFSLALLENLAWPMAGVLILLAFSITCMATCNFTLLLP